MGEMFGLLVGMLYFCYVVVTKMMHYVVRFCSYILLYRDFGPGGPSGKRGRVVCCAAGDERGVGCGREG